MSELTNILDRFNRKERNLLIRDALGHSDKALSLSDDFRERIGGALGDLEVPKDAWWATDYHLNWIAGALALWRVGEQAIGTAQTNDQSKNPVRRLVERNQEDADLLVAFDETLILIEVKAFGYFTNRQLNSKFQRWRLLKRQSEFAKRKVKFHFMLMSRTEPAGLNLPPDDLLPGRNKWPHAVLKVHSPSQKLKVTGRKPGAAAPEPDPETWFIVSVPSGTDDDDEEGDLSGSN